MMMMNDSILSVLIKGDNDGYLSVSNHNSTDILCKNCITDFDQIACIRSSSIGFITLITSMFCAIRIFHLHRPSTVDYHKLILFYILFIQTLSGSLEWLFGWKTEAALVNIYARALELLIIFHLYLMIASRLLTFHHNNTSTTNRLSLSGLAVMLVYFTIIVYAGLIFALEPYKDCHAPYWIWLSAGNVITVQLIMISFVVIIYRLNRLSSLQNTRYNKQKYDLYCLLWAFETSTLVDLAYHITLYLLANEEHGCNAVFKYDQKIYTMVKIPYEMISFLMPIWVILFIFRSDSKIYSNLFDYFDLLTNGNVRSLNNVVIIRNWYRRYRPLGSSQWSYVDHPSSTRAHHSTTLFSGDLSRIRRLISSSSNDGLLNRVRRTQSAPILQSLSFNNRRNLFTNNNTNNSIITSPLYAIPEESFNNNNNNNNNSSHLSSSLSVSSSSSSSDSTLNTSTQCIIHSDNDNETLIH